MDDGSRELTARYDQEASAYRRLWAPVLEQAGRRVLEPLASVRERRVLEMGSGVGRLLPAIQNAFPHATIIAADRSRGMVSYAPRTFPCVIADARETPVTAGSLDVVLMPFMLFHLPRPIEGVTEAARILRPGGRLGTVTWSRDLSSRAEEVWQRCLDAHRAPPYDPASVAAHESVGTASNMTALLEGAAFGAVHAWTETLVYPFPRERLIELKTHLGRSRARLAGMSEPDRRTCLERAEAELSRLDNEAFTATAEIVYAIAEKPGG